MEKHFNARPVTLSSAITTEKISFYIDKNNCRNVDHNYQRSAHILIESLYDPELVHTILPKEIAKIVEDDRTYLSKMKFNVSPSYGDYSLTTRALINNWIIINNAMLQWSLVYTLETSSFSKIGDVVVLKTTSGPELITDWNMLCNEVDYLRARMCLFMYYDLEKLTHLQHETKGLIDAYNLDFVKYGDKIRLIQKSIPMMTLYSTDPNVTITELYNDSKDPFPDSKVFEFFSNTNLGPIDTLRLGMVYKMFGYITVDKTMAEDEFQHNCSFNLDVDPFELNLTLCYWRWEILRGYFKANGHYPKTRYAHPIIQAYLSLNQPIPDIVVPFLDSLVFGHTFDMDYSLTIQDLLQDRAICPPKHLLNEKQLPLKHRNYLMAVLNEQHLDLEEVINQSKDGFSPDEMVIKFALKDKELKEKGRQFGITCFKPKAALQNLNKNAMTLLKYFEGDVTTVSQSDKEEIIEDMLTKFRSGDYHFIVIDFKNWYKYFTERNTRTFVQDANRLFGSSGLFNFMIDIARRSLHTFTYPGGRPQLCNNPDLSSANGFAQHFWSSKTKAVTTKVLNDHFSDYSVAFSGDNITVMVKETTEEALIKFRKDLVRRCRGDGHLIKEEDCWFSNCVGEFLQRRFFNGQEIPQDLKKMTRAMVTSDEYLKGDNSVVSSIFSSCSDLVSSPSINLLNSRKIALDMTFIHFRSIYRDVDTRILTIPSILGGYPIPPIEFHMIKGIEDPLSLFCCHLKNHPNSKFLETILKRAIRSRPLSDLINNPYSLPVRKNTDMKKELMKEADQELMDITNNQSILDMITMRSNDESLYRTLTSMIPYDPIISQIIYESSVTALKDQVKSKFTRASTLVTLKINEKELSLRKFDESYFQYLSKLSKSFRGRLLLDLSKPSVQVAQDLSSLAWKIPFSNSFRVPPLEMLTIIGDDQNRIPVTQGEYPYRNFYSLGRGEYGKVIHNGFADSQLRSFEIVKLLPAIKVFPGFHSLISKVENCYELDPDPTYNKNILVSAPTSCTSKTKYNIKNSNKISLRQRAWVEMILDEVKESIRIDYSMLQAVCDMYLSYGCDSLFLNIGNYNHGPTVPHLIKDFYSTPIMRNKIDLVNSPSLIVEQSVYKQFANLSTIMSSSYGDSLYNVEFSLLKMSKWEKKKVGEVVLVKDTGTFSTHLKSIRVKPGYTKVSTKGEISHLRHTCNHPKEEYLPNHLYIMCKFPNDNDLRDYYTGSSLSVGDYWIKWRIEFYMGGRVTLGGNMNLRSGSGTPRQICSLCFNKKISKIRKKLHQET